MIAMVELGRHSLYGVEQLELGIPPEAQLQIQPDANLRTEICILASATMGGLITFDFELRHGLLLAVIKDYASLPEEVQIRTQHVVYMVKYPVGVSIDNGRFRRI